MLTHILARFEMIFGITFVESIHKPAVVRTSELLERYLEIPYITCIAKSILFDFLKICLLGISETT